MFIEGKRLIDVGGHLLGVRVFKVASCIAKCLFYLYVWSKQLNANICYKIKPRGVLISCYKFMVSGSKNDHQHATRIWI